MTARTPLGAATLPVAAPAGTVRAMDPTHAVDRPASAMTGAERDEATADGPLAVRTEGLTKRFPSGQVAVDGVELVVPRGAVYGFLGPNGSGKTTTLRMLLGLVRPTAGRAWLLDEPMPAGRAVLERVGVLVEGPGFQPYLSGRANLERLDAFDASADPRTARRRVDDALARVGLTAAAGKRYRQYSLGMKQRLGLAAALLRPRDLLVLDEPTNGLDPQGTREVRVLVRELAEAGTTVLVSSHLLSEIEQVCSHVGIMSRGRLVLQGRREALTQLEAPRVVVETAPAQAPAAMAALASLGLADVAVEAGTVRALLGAVPVPRVAEALVAAGVDVLGLEVRRPSLEELFVTLTGEGFDVAR